MVHEAIHIHIWSGMRVALPPTFGFPCTPVIYVKLTEFNRARMNTFMAVLNVALRPPYEVAFRRDLVRATEAILMVIIIPDQNTWPLALLVKVDRNVKR